MYLRDQKPASYRASGLLHALLDWTDCTKWQGQAKTTNKRLNLICVIWFFVLSHSEDCTQMRPFKCVLLYSPVNEALTGDHLNIGQYYHLALFLMCGYWKRFSCQAVLSRGLIQGKKSVDETIVWPLSFFKWYCTALWTTYM